MTKVIRQGGSKGVLCRGSFLPPRDYFEEVVSPNVDCLALDEGSKQMAFNAAVGLYHMVDYVCEFAEEHNISWFPQAGLGGINEYREMLASKCPEFAITEAVALVYKHYKIGNKRAQKIASSISDIKREHVGLDTNNTGIAEEGVSFHIDFSKPYRVEEKLIVTSRDGDRYVVSEVLSKVRDMWREELDAIGMDALFPFDLKDPNG